MTKLKASETRSTDVNGRPIVVEDLSRLLKEPMPQLTRDPFTGGDGDGLNIKKIAQVTPKVAQPEMKIHTAEPAVTPPTKPTYFHNVPFAVPVSSSTLIDEKGIVQSVDRKELDAALEELDVAELWADQAQDEYTVANAAYQESLNKPYTSYEEMVSTAAALLEKTTSTDYAVTIADSRTKFKVINVEGLTKIFNAAVGEKIKAAILVAVSTLRVQEGALQDAFTRKVLEAFKQTGFASPGPEAWREYQTTFVKLAAQEAELTGLATKYNLGFTAATTDFKLLVPDHIIALAKYDDIHGVMSPTTWAMAGAA